MRLRHLTAALPVLSLACSHEPASGARRLPQLPLFAAADSVIYVQPGLGSDRDRVIGVFALGDSGVAVVTSQPGGIGTGKASSGAIELAKTPPGFRPEFAAPCTQGGVAIVGSPEGTLLHLRTDGSVVAAGRIPAGRLLGMQCESPNDFLMLVDGPLPSVRTASLVRVGSALLHVTRSDSATTIDTLGAFSGRELLRLSPTDPGIEPPYGVTVRFAAGPTRVFLASSDETSIAELQTNGRGLGAIDVISDERAVPRSEVDSAVRAELGARLSSLPSTAVSEMIDALAKNRTLPRWAGIAVDPGENVWLASSGAADRDGDRIWTIYRSDGTRRARVYLPEAFQVTQVQTQYVLGFVRGLPAARAARMIKLQLLGG